MSHTGTSIFLAYLVHPYIALAIVILTLVLVPLNLFLVRFRRVTREQSGAIETTNKKEMRSTIKINQLPSGEEL